MQQRSKPRCEWRAMAWLAICVLTATAAWAQPLVQGRGKTPSGMLYYDAAAAEDRQPRTYRYTICPDSAACISLDFNLVRSVAQVDFITVYEGVGVEGPPIGTLGGKSGSILLYGRQSCLTFEFKRVGPALESTWTALWHSQSETNCHNPKRSGKGVEGIRDICGPEFHEQFHHFGTGGMQFSEHAGACITRPHNTAWYRFIAAKDGWLQFTIAPDNGFDDYDWVLWQQRKGQQFDLARLDSTSMRLACNYAGGRGAGGTTGMTAQGRSSSGDATGSPYCSRVMAHKGDVFYLLIDDYSRHSTGFRLNFNDVVVQCGNPQPDVLDMGRVSDLPVARTENRDFMRYRRVLRLDLQTKANQPIARCPLEADAFKTLSRPDKAAVFQPERQSGICVALLCALRGGFVPAYRPDQPDQPLHFGDLLELAYRHQPASPEGDYWRPDWAVLAPFLHYIELLVDERMDRNTGRQTQVIRYVRLLWADGDGQLPDFNAAIFRYPDLVPLLENVLVPDPHNDAGTMSLHDYLEARLYEAVTVERSNGSPRSLSGAKFADDRQLELENYLWRN
jgi:hypothetical protein